MISFSLNIHGKLHHFARPLVMGILNVTPDSFYAGSRAVEADDIARRAAALAAEGADIIDVGAMSTRPGHAEVDATDEAQRLLQALPLVRQAAPGVLISVDTFRAAVAQRAVAEGGADMVNDISGGLFDADMYATVAALRVPYVLQHLWGDIDHYPTALHPSEAPAAEVCSDLMALCRRAELAGIIDIIVDPGFGFGKTVEQNYEILHKLGVLQQTGRPLLVGLSRKSMITKPLGITAAQALAGTIALNAFALDRGAAILRVHDVAPARQAVELYQLMQQAQ